MPLSVEHLDLQCLLCWAHNRATTCCHNQVMAHLQLNMQGWQCASACVSHRARVSAGLGLHSSALRHGSLATEHGFAAGPTQLGLHSSTLHYGSLAPYHAGVEMCLYQWSTSGTMPAGLTRSTAPLSPWAPSQAR